MNSKISTIMMVASGVGQLGSMVVAGMYLQAVKREHEDEFQEERDEDRDVLEAVQEEERDSQVYLQKTAWGLMPCWLKSLLFIGSWAICAMMHIVLAYVTTPFRDFQLTDSICDPEGLRCNPLNIVLFAGWIGIILLGFASLCQAACSIWCRCAAKRELSDSPDSEELLSESDTE